MGLFVGLVVTLAAAAMPAAASALTIDRFDGALESPSGEVVTQAGSHADIFTSIGFTPGENVKDISVALPPGIVANTTTLPKCSQALLTAGESGRSACPESTQVGTAIVSTEAYTLGFAVYNMIPPPGAPAQLGFNIVGVQVYLTARVRPDDYGVTMESLSTSQAVNIVGTDVTIWGVPADPVHDDLRGPAFFPGVGPFLECNDGGAPPCKAHTPIRPFTSIGSDCSAAPGTVHAQANGWDTPGTVDERQFTFNDKGLPPNPVSLTGCEKVPFGASLSLQPDSKIAGAPTGVAVRMTIPQNQSPKGLAPSDLKDARVTFPAGMSLNPAAAGGLSGCSEGEARMGQEGPARCPNSAKVGSVEVDSPLLDEPLTGAVYQAAQGANPFNSLLALYLVIENEERGIHIKVPGQVTADSVTGQLVASFKNNPQLPFEALTMQLKGGPRAPLVNPSSCGTYTTHAELTSWARPNEAVPSVSTFTIDQGCGNESKFTPRLQAGTVNPIAGDHSPFTLRVTRPDGQQNVQSIAATLPEGVLAKLAGVPLCGDADASTGNCPTSSQVGTATVGAGAGSDPLYVPQPGKSATAVYLAGPYKGAPYSLVAKVPAQAGPFDLGTVAVRNTINVDPTTAQVSVASDPLPQILQGIPIAYRDIRVDVDRNQFTLNPTSCDPMAVQGTIRSAGGQSAAVSDRFQVANCANLTFKPKLALRLSGAPPRRGGYPKLTATLTMPKGGANIEKAVATMPKTQFLENSHIRTICTRVQYAAGKGGGGACPKGSVYGYAKAWTPLLDKPLEGPVYLRSSSDQLPNLVASLDGGIHVDLVGKIDSPNARLRTTFRSVPDAPVSKFVLTMQGGKKGLLVNNTNLCKAKPRASAQFDGQNGKISDSNPLVKVGGCGKKAKRQK